MTSAATGVIFCMEKLALREQKIDTSEMSSVEHLRNVQDTPGCVELQSAGYIPYKQYPIIYIYSDVADSGDTWRMTVHGYGVDLKFRCPKYTHESGDIRVDLCPIAELLYAANTMALAGMKLGDMNVENNEETAAVRSLILSSRMQYRELLNELIGFIALLNDYKGVKPNKYIFNVGWIEYWRKEKDDRNFAITPRMVLVFNNNIAKEYYYIGEDFSEEDRISGIYECIGRMTEQAHD